MGNITPKGVRRRQRTGVVAGIVALALAAWMLATRQPTALVLLLLVPFTLSAIGFLQARHRTCVVLAAAGECETEQGTAPMPAADRDRVRAEAAIVTRHSFLAGALATFAVLMIRMLLG